MKLEEVLKFQLKTVNPFPGLVIDADAWRDAHVYHREQLRLHYLLCHSPGIIEGLEVTAGNPPDLSLTISPGVAVDPTGNIIMVAQPQKYRIQTREKALIYLVIQYREVPAGPYQPPEGGQPTRIIEGYRIQERDRLPDEPFLELARIDFDPAKASIHDAANKNEPGRNEINPAFRQIARQMPPAVSRAPEPAPVAPPPRQVSEAAKKVAIIGHAVLGKAARDLHAAGVKNLVRNLNSQEGIAYTLEENTPLDANLGRLSLLYVTGNSTFELSARESAALSGLVEAGGIIMGEGCFEGRGDNRGAREFGLAFNQVASQLKSRLGVVARGHVLLSVPNLFAELPAGAVSPGMLMQDGNLVYSGSDYACACTGGTAEHPLSREIIRSAFELMTNIVFYAQAARNGRRT